MLAGRLERAAAVGGARRGGASREASIRAHLGSAEGEADGITHPRVDPGSDVSPVVFYEPTAKKGFYIFAESAEGVHFNASQKKG